MRRSPIVRRSLCLACLTAAAARADAPATRPSVPPAERVARIAALEREFRVVDPILQFGANPTLRGRVHTADGKPLPADATLTLYNFRRKGLVLSSIPLGADGAFEQTQPVTLAIAAVVAQADGYATLISPRLQPNANGEWPALDLTLQPAAPVAVRVVDEDGKAVAGARVGATLVSTEPGIDAQVRERAATATTDADGRTNIGAGPNATIRFRASADGYQSAATLVTVSPGERSATLTLLKRLSTAGQVIDATTREAIGGATLTVVRRRDVDGTAQTWPPGMPTAEGQEPPITFNADVNGGFVTDRLGDDATYDLLVAAPGHGCELLRDVRGGASELVCALGGPRPVKVDVRAPGVALVDRPTTATVHLTLPLVDAAAIELPAVPIRWDGDVGRITIDDPLPGRLQLAVQGMLPTLPIDAAPGDPVRNLTVAPAPPAGPPAVAAPATAPGEAVPVRELRCTIATADGFVPDAGSVTFNVHGERRWDLTRAPIRGGVATIPIVPASEAQLSDARVPGYWVARDYTHVDLPSGNAPVPVSLAAYQAGAIVARVRTADGRPADGQTSVTVEPLTSPSDRPNNRSPMRDYDTGVRTADGRSLYTALPLGEACRVIAWRGAQVSVSEPVTPDEATPVVELDVTLPEGAPLDVVVRDADGGPAAFRAVSLSVVPKASVRSRVIVAHAVTDREGRARFEHVDASAATLTLTASPDGDGPPARTTVEAMANGPVQLRLQGGVQVRGRVIDAEANRPIRDAHVTLHRVGDDPAAPLEYDAFTDVNGEFVARGLTPGQYTVRAPDTYPAGTRITRDAIGQAAAASPPDNATDPTVTAGSGDAVELRRVRMLVAPR